MIMVLSRNLFEPSDMKQPMASKTRRAGGRGEKTKKEEGGEKVGNDETRREAKKNGSARLCGSRRKRNDRIPCFVGTDIRNVGEEEK